MAEDPEEELRRKDRSFVSTMVRSYEREKARYEGRQAAHLWLAGSDELRADTVVRATLVVGYPNKLLLRVLKNPLLPLILLERPRLVSRLEAAGCWFEDGAWRAPLLVTFPQPEANIPFYVRLAEGEP